MGAGMPPAPIDATLNRKMAELWRAATTTDGLWRYNEDRDGVTCYVPLDGMPSARGDGFVPYPRRAIWDLLVAIERKGETDSQFETGHQIVIWSGHSKLTYMRFKGIGFVSGRDFCNVTHWRVDEDGNLIILAFSEPSPDCPEVKGAVRALLEVGGWIIRPRPGVAALRARYGDDIAAGRRPPPHADPEVDAEGCDCTFLMRSDFRGSIPAFVTRAVAAQQALLVAKVREVLDKLYAAGGREGPAALAALRRQPLVNDDEAAAIAAWEAAMAAHAAVVAAAAVAAAAPAAPVPPAAPIAEAGEAAAPTEVVAAAGPPLVAVHRFYPPQLPPAQYAGALERHVDLLRRSATTTEGLWKYSAVKDGITCYVGLDSRPSARGGGFLPFPRRAIWDSLVRVEEKVGPCVVWQQLVCFEVGHAIHRRTHCTHRETCRGSKTASLSADTR